jgi:multiple sugar transport system permease protein
MRHLSMKYDRVRDVLTFLLPSFLGFCIFILFPILASMGLSLTDYTGGKRINFVGLHNYLVAFQSSNFHKAVWVTVKFVIATIGFQIGIALILAVILNSKIRGRNFFRSVIFLPVVLSTVAISLSFMIIFHPQKGPVNNFLISIGLDPLPWLTGIKTALPTIIFIVLWQTVGYYMVLLLSGLQTINPALYEAAEIDGASGVQKFLHVTIPMLTPVLFLCIILAIIRAFQVFDQIFVLTGGQDGGGPAGSTTTLVFEVYLNAFSHWKMGYASAEATILLIIILIITVIQYWRQSKWVSYDIV